jgi:alpha-1,2-mannosyltransferase
MTSAGPVVATAQSATAAALARRRKLYALLGLLLVAPLVMLIYRPAGHGLDVTGHQIGRDFIGVWAGPQLAFGGKLAVLFDLEAYPEAISALFGQPLPFHNWGYPLFTLLTFWPLAQLPYFVALAVWTFGLFALFAAVTLREVAPEQRGMALLALACAPACLINAIGGQNGFLSGALLIGGVLVLDRRPLVGGVLFGLLTFKPHLGVVLAFALIALGAWRAIASAVVTAVVLVAVSVAAFGIEPWRQYMEVTSAFQVQLLERFHGFYTFMMASVTAGARTVDVPYRAALIIQGAVSLPVLAAACWAVRRTSDPCRRAFVLAAATPLVTPYAFNYDLTWLAAVQVWMLSGRLPWRPEWSALALVGWALPLVSMYAAMLGIGIAPLILMLLFWASLREASSAPAAISVPRPDSGAGRWPSPVEA